MGPHQFLFDKQGILGIFHLSLKMHTSKDSCVAYNDDTSQKLSSGFPHDSLVFTLRLHHQHSPQVPNALCRGR